MMDEDGQDGRYCGRMRNALAWHPAAGARYPNPANTKTLKPFVALASLLLLQLGAPPPLCSPIPACSPAPACTRACSRSLPAPFPRRLRSSLPLLHSFCLLLPLLLPLFRMRRPFHCPLSPGRVLLAFLGGLLGTFACMIR